MQMSRPDLPESFIHFIWQHQYLNPATLQTTTGEQVLVHFPGWINSDAGPDFFQARLRIGELEWTGAVEMHVHASDYHRHGHQHDPAYDNIILHVVWYADQTVRSSDGGALPTLELWRVVDFGLLKRWKDFACSESPVLCSSLLPRVSKQFVHQMMAQAGAERLDRKAAFVLELLDAAKGDWQETVWRLFARTMGLRANADAMLDLALRLPAGLLLRYRNQQQIVEALIFGVAGFLEGDPVDDYHRLLQMHFQALGPAHGLVPLAGSQWKFSRMRPAHFPTNRLAQMAAIVHHMQVPWSSWMSCYALTDWERMVRVSVSAYWQKHTHFGKPGMVSAAPGMGWVHHLQLNLLAPLLAASGKRENDMTLRERAIQIWMETPAEQNRITRIWNALGVKSENAFESQAMWYQYNSYCIRRRCLSCSVGHHILNRSNPLHGLENYEAVPV